MTPVTVPPLLATRLELLTWHKPDGADVGVGEPLAEIRLEGSPAMVDCTVELTAPATGKLRMTVGHGAVVTPGQQIGAID